MGALVAALLAALLSWIVSYAVLDNLDQLWHLLSQVAFTTPDVSTLPAVTALAHKSLMVVNVCFILAVIMAGVLVMVQDSVQSRYGLGELVPRLAVGWIAANFAIPICQGLVQFANAVTSSLTGQSLSSGASLDQLHQTTTDALNRLPPNVLTVVVGLLIAGLTATLLVMWIVRLGVLLVLVGISPAALACHATPVTEPAARLWWRCLLATLATVVLQAVALYTALTALLGPTADSAALGLPHDPTGTFHLLVVLCLLWAVVKIPGLMSRYVAAGGGGRNVAGLILRMVVVQQMASRLRLRRRRGVHGGDTAGDTAPRGDDGGGAGSGNSTRMPRPMGPGGGGRPTATAPRRGGGRRPPPPPRGGGSGRVGVAWPTGRPVPPYTAQQLAVGVDPATRAVPKQAAPTPPRSSQPPIRAAGVAPTPPAPRPVIPAGANPATAMPATRPVRQPVRPVPRRRVRNQWNRPTRT